MKTLTCAGFLLVGLIFCNTARAAAPTAVTLTPTNVTTNSVTVTGSANPNGLATIAFFQWGTTTNYGMTTAPQALGSGNSPIAVQANLSSLLTDTNYHYRLVASNSSGVTYGSNVIVTPTLLLYLYAGESWSYTFHDLPYRNVYFFSDTPQDRVNFPYLPGSFAPGSAVRVELFADSTNVGPAYSTILTNPSTGFYGAYPSLLWADLQGAVRLTVLTGSVVVSSMTFQRFVETGGGGFGSRWEYGNTIIPTKFPQPSSLGTQFVASVNIQSAVINTDINANNLPTGVFVQWGTTTNYGSASGAVLVNFDYFVRRDITISNLGSGTTYHVRVVATNSAGTNYGRDITLTTPTAVITMNADNRTGTSAVLNASVTLGPAPTGGYFEWGPTTTYGQTTPLQNFGSGTAVTNMAAPLTGLNPQTVYHCQAVVIANGVTNRGGDVVFSTTSAANHFVVTNLATEDVRGAIERGGNVTFACDGVLTLSNQIDIANDVCLDATGHAITLSGNNITRIFRVRPGILLTLTNITLANGRSTNGGAIYNEGTVVAQDCRFLSNVVIGVNGANGTNGSGGISNSTCALVTPGSPGERGFDGGAALGGAVLSVGELTAVGCHFLNNRAVGGNGGNGGWGGNGGRCHSSPFNSQLGGNGGWGGNGGGAQGSAIASFGSLQINRCSFSDCASVGGTGGLGGIGGANGNNFGGGGAPGFAGLGGSAMGGAISAQENLLVSNSVFFANSARGGTGGAALLGVFSWGCGRATNGGPALGGAIYVSNGVVANCTFATNAALGGDGGAGGFCSGPGSSYPHGNGGNAFGGSIANAGGLQFINVTVDGNAARGGIALTNFTGNFVWANGSNGIGYGGSIANTGGVFQIVNTILSGGTSNNSFGVITDLGHNISSDATPAWTSGTSVNNTDALLAPLANNGGPTLTMALLPGSPALNNADSAASPAKDQRGVARPRGDGFDIGAFEGPDTPALFIQRGSPTHTLRWLGYSGQTYRVDASSNFVHWTPVFTNITATNGTVEQSVSTNPPSRFFRLFGD